MVRWPTPFYFERRQLSGARIEENHYFVPPCAPKVTGCSHTPAALVSRLPHFDLQPAPRSRQSRREPWAHDCRRIT